MSSLYELHLQMAPIRIEFELTEACNLRCTFCYNSRQPLYTSLEKASAILESLARQGVLEIVLTGGEPTLHPDFRGIAAIAGERFNCALLQTNGTFLDDDLLAFLEAVGFAGLSISLHGPRDRHDRLTQKEGSYDAAVAAIKKTVQTQLQLWVNMVVTKDNTGTVVNHMERLTNEGVRAFTFTRFTPVGCGKENDAFAPSRAELVEFVREVDEFQARIPGCTVLIANSIPRCCLPENLGIYSEACSYGLNRFYVDVHGHLMTCGMARTRIGNILTTSLSSLKAQSPHFKELCTDALLPADCRSCEFVSSCRGGCRAAALSSTGSLNGIDPLAVLPHISAEVAKEGD